MEEEHFNKVYGRIKQAVIAEMNAQKSGTVVVLTSSISGYLSKAWIAKAAVRLNDELIEEFGIDKVYFQAPDTSDNKESAFIVVG